MGSKKILSVEEMAKTIANSLNAYRMRTGSRNEHIPMRRDALERALKNEGCQYITATVTLLVEKGILHKTNMGNGTNAVLYYFADISKPIHWSLISPMVTKYRNAAKSNRGGTIPNLDSTTSWKSKVLEKKDILEIVRLLEISIEELYAIEEIVEVALPYIAGGDKYLIIKR